MYCYQTNKPDYTVCVVAFMGISIHPGRVLELERLKLPFFTNQGLILQL